ncbi:hypothetical protein [Paenibacillus sp. GYB003]|uniref:hypothetical protein n=1 Tax=Paenibacillus sp. GYB003 TaxID=2994392 RepID=UPI002F96A948
MFIGLVAHGDPFWIAWSLLLDVALLSLMYGSGVLFIVVGDQYYGATDSKIFANVTSRYLLSPVDVKGEFQNENPKQY